MHTGCTQHNPQGYQEVYPQALQPQWNFGKDHRAGRGGLLMGHVGCLGALPKTRLLALQGP